MNSGIVLREMVKRLTPLLGTYALPYTERILQHLFSSTRTQLYMETGRNVDDEMLRHIEFIIDRCCTNEPVDYILGMSYFYDREFTVSPAVLLPRPDTEILIETVLQFESASKTFFADIGTGSGIIACILTEKRPGWVAVGIDSAVDAIKIAQVNRRNNRIALVCSDFLSAVSAHRQFDFIVSNPPYISTSEIESLDKSVRCFEPHQALDGGSDGLDYYRLLALEAPSYLKYGGCLYCEIGYDQEQPIRKLFGTSEWNSLTFFKDLSGHFRVFRIRYGETSHEC